MKNIMIRVLVSFACGVTIISVMLAGLLEGLELKTLDARFKRRGAVPPNQQIAIIAIDDESLDKIEQPLSLWNGVLATVIAHLKTSGVRAIGVDVLQPKSFDPWTKEAYDQQLTRTLIETVMSGVPVTLGYLAQPGAAGSHVLRSIEAFNFAVQGNVGFYNLFPDKDDFVRRQPLRYWNAEDQRWYPGFALLVTANFLGERLQMQDDRLVMDGQPVPLDQKGAMLINFAGPTATFPTYSFVEVLQAAETGDAQYFAQRFKDKLVLLGMTAVQMQDLHAAPFYGYTKRGTQRMPGVEIHANVAHTLLSQMFIQRLSRRQVGLMVLLFSLGFGMLFFHVRLFAGTLFALTGIAAYGLLAFFAFAHGWWLDLVAPVGTVILSYGAVFAYRFAVEERERRFLQKNFATYVNPHILALLKDPKQLAGSRQKVTLLFSDIRGFTTLSEKLPPEEVKALLDEYLSLMTEAIFEYNGTLDKFMGDGIMAIYGAPLPILDSACHAVRSAVLMSEKLDAFNAKRTQSGAQPLEIGIGIHTGEAMVGSLGSSQKMDYTAIGDTVNTASRLEGLNKKFHSRILISAATYQEVQEIVQAELLGSEPVKGREETITVYQVHGLNKM